VIDEHELVRRAVERLAPPEPAFDRLLDRRDRRRRNERTAALVGIAVFAATAWAVANSEPRRTVQPAVPRPTTVRVPEPVPEATYPGPVGLTGLPSPGSTPSSPTKGQLVLHFGFAHTAGDPGNFRLNLYEDGRLIWNRLGDGRTRTAKPTGWIEQRLTAEGVDLIRSEVLSTGLFDRDLHFSGGEGLFSGAVEVQDGDLRVLVTWGDVGAIDLDGVERVVPTREQATALRRLDARLLNTAAWLPASAWEDQELRPFVPSMFSICYDTEADIGLEGVLAQFPREADDLLRSWQPTYEAIRGGADSPTGIDIWCSRAPTEQARSLARVLDDARSQEIEGQGELGYVFGGDDPETADVILWFGAVLPHDVM
jgi:hypothetical protein